MSITINEANFNERLEAARANAGSSINEMRLGSEIAVNDTLKRESISRLTMLLQDIAMIVDMDSEVMAKKIAATRKVPYGRIPGMINILCAVYSWPTDKTAEIAAKQDEILDELSQFDIDGDLLLDTKDSKGFHTFFADTGVVMEGQDPEYEEYAFYIRSIAAKLGLSFIDFKLSEAKWDKEEVKAQAKADVEYQAALKALAMLDETTDDEEQESESN